MFFTKTDTANLDPTDASARARAARKAAGVSKQVQQGVHSARRWAAPKLESAADYATATVAPTVSSALRNTAKQVRPVDTVSPARRRAASALTWSLLGAAIVAAAGAAAALVRYRRRAAIELDTEMPDTGLGETATSVSGQTAGRTPTEPVVPAAKTSSNASASQTKTAADASVNGHASTNGW